MQNAWSGVVSLSCFCLNYLLDLQFAPGLQVGHGCFLGLILFRELKEELDTPL